ncbi:protein S100-Z isoform X2 [Phaenicophaeus curvirostris]|uniref:protein S100-Z isoform X2 n=1 Tax=Phaenicophaeus curvirostris TaxID=33595 RepID=UPI0037F0AA2A
MGFEGKVTITSCEFSISLHTPQIVCKAALPLTTMSTPLEDAMDTLIRIFHHYSGKEGDRYKLSKGELKELLTSELTDFLSGQKDPFLVDKIMKDLDSNKDNEVDFNEFVILVAALTVACNDFFEEQLKKEEF